MTPKKVDINLKVSEGFINNTKLKEIVKKRKRKIDNQEVIKK